MEDWGSILSKGHDYSLRHWAETDSEAHSASCVKGIGDYFLWGKTTGA
jgi:hypothetical protein